MKGYKVTRKKYGGFVSSFIDKEEGRVKYRKGEFVEPKEDCGPLCVFDTKENALLHSKFVAELSDIWECEYEEQDKDCVWVINIGKTLGELVKGTRLAKKVKLIREVCP